MTSNFSDKTHHQLFECKAFELFEFVEALPFSIWRNSKNFLNKIFSLFEYPLKKWWRQRRLPYKFIYTYSKINIKYI